MKRVIAIVLALVMVLAIVACTPQGATTPASSSTSQSGTSNQDTSSQSASTGSELAGEYTIKVWAADKVVDLTKKQIEDFNNTNEYGIKFIATVEAVGEGDAASKMQADVDAGGDIFFFAQDQLNRLIMAGALDPLGKSASEFVQNNNVEAASAAALSGDTYYAYPVTADNTYFVYYDKSVVKEESLGDIELMIADCEAAGKNFCFDLKNGWYITSFFFGAGCKSVWEADNDGKFLSVSDNFNSEKGLAAAKALNKVMSSDKFVGSSETSEFDNNAGFVVSGTWNETNARSILGDNFGAAPLPKYTVDGKSYQISPFTGSKLVGVKPQNDPKLGAALHRLAQYLTGEKGQIERFEAATWGPSNKAAAQNETVLANAVMGAIAQQASYSVMQGNIPGNWWGNSAQVLGEALDKAESEADIKAALAAYEESLGDYLKKEGEEELPESWGVIGTVCGSNWDTDFEMTEKEPGVWVSEPLECKAGEEFKVRQDKSWDVNYGMKDGETVAGGVDTNVVIPADDIYTITFDKNTATLSFVNQDGIVPEAAPAPEGEEEAADDVWSVIGGICGTAWDTDFEMFENKEVGLWQAVLPIKVGEEFKFRANADWAKDIGIDEEGIGAYKGGNLQVEEDGTYYLAIDLSGETPVITVEKIESWGVIGGFEASGWGTDIPMTETELGIWVSDPVALAAGNEYKVRANADWAVNFGITDGAIKMGGNNVAAEADGTYIITLDLNARTLIAAAH